MTQHTDIRTLQDGSIDYAHYIARSHEIRSIDAHHRLTVIRQMFAAAWAMVKPPIGFHPDVDYARTACSSLERTGTKSPVPRMDARRENNRKTEVPIFVPSIETESCFR